ncbi:MAG: hypothetical protein KBD21_04565 [Candidatus Pacebacteria bacterium]|nr:hypothetical protein [Candidatus Paceibacterota bacterium]
MIHIRNTFIGLQKVLFRPVALVMFAGAVLVALLALEGLTFASLTEKGYAADESTTTPTTTISEETFTLHEAVSTCPPVELSVNGTTFSWTGCPRMQRYMATFCDGTTVGPVYDDWEGDVTIDLGKRIQSVQACGSDCTKRVEQSCPAPTPEPVAPVCPFTPNASTTVVSFNNTKLYSNSTQAESESGPYTISLATGTYKVETASWDGYTDRVTVSQPRESWLMDLRTGSNATAVTTSATTDLADMVVESFVQETVNSSLIIPQTVSSVVVRHAAYPDTTSYNSVVPICASFTKIPQTPPAGPTCSATMSPSSVKRGNQATLTWTSVGAVSASFDQNIGTTTTSGSLVVTPSNNTTYTGTFVDAGGRTTTCAASVSISTGGGGGKCLNCDDDDDKKEDDDEDREPTFVLGKTISKTGTTITLDQIPYTGFEAGPVLTAFFWIGLFALSVGIAHVITKTRPLMHVADVMRSRSGDRVPFLQGNKYTDSTIIHEQGTHLLYDAPVHSLQSEKPSIEDRAHLDNILLSPESLRIITDTIARQGIDQDRFLQELFSKAIATYSREDGWILLSQERTLSLMTQNGMEKAPATAVSDSTPSQQHVLGHNRAQGNEQVPASVISTTSIAQHPNATVKTQGATTERFEHETAIPMFLDYLNTREHQKAFELLRQLGTKGVQTEKFITTLVRKLDDVYKNRIEGNHAPDRDVATKTATWSNADFENILGILVECIDYSYSNNKVGTKVALTKLFARGV